MVRETIIYEQPLNEHIRFCLRLEHLFTQAKHYIVSQHIWDTRTALATIIEILEAIDRSDIKSKLTTALRVHSTKLMQLQCLPNIDKEKLQNILNELNQSIVILHNTEGKLCQDLREDNFLAAIRQRNNTPGGTCNFAIPAYYLWLQKSPAERQKILNTWFSAFDRLQIIVSLLLQLTRESGTLIQQIAQNGFYQEALATNIAYQMIRVAIPKDINIYPEISVGRHRLSVHFYTLNINSCATQTTNDINFELTCCKV